MVNPTQQFLVKYRGEVSGFFGGEEVLNIYTSVIQLFSYIGVIHVLYSTSELL